MLDLCEGKKGKDLDYWVDPLKDRSVLEYLFDFVFLGDEFGHKIVVLVGNERLSGLMLVMVIVLICCKCKLFF